MDRNQIIGIGLIFILFFVWSQMNAPTEEQLAQMRAEKDSITQIQEEKMSDKDIKSIQEDVFTQEPQLSDSARALSLNGTLGPFSSAGTGKEKVTHLENELVKVAFSNKGGKIIGVQLKEYSKIIEDKKKKEIQVPLILMEDDKDVFEYIIPSDKVNSGKIRTSDLYFTPQIQGNKITFTAQGADGAAIVQTYELGDKSYNIEYDLSLQNADSYVSSSADAIRLNWVNHLDKLEKNTQYEKFYSTVYFKELDDDPDYCSCRKSAVEDLTTKKLKWVSNSNQFFNSSLIAKESFDGGKMETIMSEEDSEDLKELRTELQIPLSGRNNESIAMSWYIGPNKFENLRAYDIALEEVIPFGRSIFGTINRWMMRPLFNWLSKYVGSKGIVILLMTLLVKILLYPLMYKMLYSQAKMSALKPELAGMREKFKDDQQKQQMESMKVYREFGVNPLGGCFPVVIQMPVWFALYRFFPASIEFRQASFLWATDLSSYDVFATLPFEIPFYGMHVSLFTILWAFTTLIYTYYNTKHMDMASMNPMMKYMQYLMPVMFLFFFNNYASGLTLYLFYSNVMNIAQTVGSKKFLFNEAKIKSELDAYRKKPKDQKKKSKIAQRFEDALKEQQRIAAEKAKQK